MAGVLGIQIGLTYDTHFYEFNGQIYKQGGGAPTGVTPVGPMSRIIMDKWVRQMREIEEKSNLLHTINPIQFEKWTIEMIKKYVDDVFYAGGEFRKGVKWDPTQKCLIWDPNKESEDKQENKTNDHRTMEIVAQIASSIIKCLKFT